MSIIQEILLLGTPSENTHFIAIEENEDNSEQTDIMEVSEQGIVFSNTVARPITIVSSILRSYNREFVIY